MATRHEIQNLVRRGHIFYWRPRVPVTFSGGGFSGHLSLSLKQSDHNRAAYIARRLNTLLHELKLRPTARMTTKDQLAALFKAEIDRMNDWMDELHFASRRIGIQDGVRDLEADLEVGWAYRLLQLFGLRRQLSFKDDCPAYMALRRAGVPDAHIENIAETFRSEQRGLDGAVFQRQLADQLAKFDIPDTLSNRERAQIEIFRAKADVLLDVEGRYPFTDRELSALTRKTVPVAEVSPTPSIAPQADPFPVSSEAIIGEPPAADNNISVSVAAPTAQIPPPATQANAGARVGVRTLALGDFMKECERLIKNNSENWAEDTAQDVRALVRILCGILEEYRVANSGEIRQEHLSALRDHFNDVPTNYGRSSRQRTLSTLALRELGKKLVETANETGSPLPKIGLSTGTIRRHLANLKHFLKHLKGAGYPLADLSLEGLMPKKKTADDPRNLTEKPEPIRIRPIFDLPVFTGCEGETVKQMAIAGDAIFHSSSYFVPMLYTYLGPRRAEMTGLAVDEIVETANGWAINLKYNQFRTLKNPQSVRTLPVPDELIRLNFIEYVHAIKALGHQALFPELHSPFYVIDTGDRFYKSFIPLLKADQKIGANLWERAFHALRHGFSDTLKQAGVDMSIIDDITGHLGRTEGEKRYTNLAGLNLIRRTISKYPVITGHLQPQPIRLLSWVQNREPPPWSVSKRRGKKVALPPATSKDAVP